MKNVEQVTYTKCAPTKRGARIWIEGAKLTAAGFTRNTPYVKLTDVDADKIILSLDGKGLSTSNGSITNGLKVAGRTRNGKDVPIIDLSAATIEPFEVGDSIRVVFTKGLIQITKHHEDQKQALREKRLSDAIKSGAVTEASLFTGGGVSTLAIHDGLADVGLGARLEYAVDQELKYLQAASLNNPAFDDDTRIIIGSVEEVEACWYEQVDVLSFSMPCAGFSRAGLVKHKQSPIEHSGTVLFGVINAIKASNPAVLISENVVEAKDSPMYQLLKAELHRTGYIVREQILDSRHTDSIENRARYWMVAVSAGLVDESFELELPEVTRSGRQLKDVFTTGHTFKPNEGLKAKAIRDAAAGKGFAKRQLLTGEETSCGTIGRFYNKNRSTEPHIVNADGDERLLDPVEHARVKSVPEALVKDVPASTAHEILGQSIDFLQALYVTTKTFAQIIANREAAMA